jgi:predicted DCC family thiol-disulfide oxidoreductase YuxK
VNTEQTEKTTAPAAGWVCYDGECAFCLRWVRRVEAQLTRRGFRFVTLQTQWVKDRLSLSEADLLAEMKLLLPDERILGGADAAVILARYVWWLWPLWLAGKMPGAMIPLRAGYRFMARNRHCSTGGCAVQKGETQ